MSIERATQYGYINYLSIHEKIIMHQPSWSYASGITQPLSRWNYKHRRSYARWLHHTPINTRKDYHASTLWSYASSITQPSWRWSYQHGKSYTRWLHHTPIKTRKDYHASTFMIIRIKHNPTILALFPLHLISRAQWSLVKIKTALRVMMNIRKGDQTSRWFPIITADIVLALGSLPTFRSISN